MQLSPSVSPSRAPSNPLADLGLPARTGKLADDAGSKSFADLLESDSQTESSESDSNEASDSETAAMMMLALLRQLPSPVSEQTKGELRLAGPETEPGSGELELADETSAGLSRSSSDEFSVLFSSNSRRGFGKLSELNQQANSNGGENFKNNKIDAGESALDAELAKKLAPTPDNRLSKSGSPSDSSILAGKDSSAQIDLGEMGSRSESAVTSMSAGISVHANEATGLAKKDMAKIAARIGGVVGTQSKVDSIGEKESISDLLEADNESDDSVGISHATEMSVMPSRASNSSSNHANSQNSDGGAAGWGARAVVNASEVSTAGSPSVPMSSVRATIAAVVSAVESIQQRADQAQQSVNLNFDIGAEKLDLRVELRSGVVHTTFKTDSPELRGALGQEWQMLMPGLITKDLTVAQPLFSTATPGHSNVSHNFSGEEQSHQRSYQNEEKKSPVPLRQAEPIVTVNPGSAPSLVSLKSNSLLNAFA